MIRILITAAAYDAILAGRSPDSVIEAQNGPQGGFYLWLSLSLAEKLKAARRPRESYSDAILRLAAQ